MKKIITIVSIAALLLMAGCAEKTENKIVDNEPNNVQNAEVTPDPTMPPAATAAPDAQEKAEQKISDGGNANATVTDSNGTREVDLKFSITNNTGIDFIGMLIEPVSVELGKGTNRFPKDFVMKNGATIELEPPAAENAGYVLDTTLFNIAAIDSNGSGYVYPNIDLSTSKSIVLMLEDGVPKAIIN